MKGEPSQKHVAQKPPEPELKVVKDVRLLPEPMQKAIRELLVQGATIEGAARSVNDREDWNETSEGNTGKSTRYNVTCDAIQEYYNADRELPRARALSLVEGTEAITRSLSTTGDLIDGEVRYVQAVVMTGLARINDTDAPLSVKDALRARAEMAVINLKIRLGKLKVSETMWHRAYEKSQTALLEQRKDFVFEQTVKLRDMMRKLEKKKNLTPETLQKIQETYGILAENVAMATAASTATEPEASLARSLADDDVIGPEPLYFTREEEVKDPRDEMIKNIKKHYQAEEGEEQL